MTQVTHTFMILQFYNSLFCLSLNRNLQD